MDLSKRLRLSTACDQCRKRKVRCDELFPQCTHCRRRGETCRTTDPKRPDQDITRRRARSSIPTPASLTSSLSTPPAGGVSSVPRPENTDSHSIGAQINTPTDPVNSINIGTPVENCPVHGDHDRPRNGDPISPMSTSAQNSMGTVEPRPTNNYHESHPWYDGDMILNTDNTSHRRKLVGGGTLQSLARYLDHYFEHRNWNLLNARFVHGMQHVEEVGLPLLGAGPSLPPLPSPINLDSLFLVYHRRIYPIFPVVNLRSLNSDALRFSRVDLRSLPRREAASLASIYAFLATVYDEMAGRSSDQGTLYLNAAYSLYSHIVASPYLSSVQALLLLTIALRARNKEGAGWETLGQAIRIAQTIGLHRRAKIQSNIPVPEHEMQGQDLDARIWWTCYCLELTMAVESGRPSMITADSCNQIIPRPTNPLAADFFNHWCRLTQIQNRVTGALYPSSMKRDGTQFLRTIVEIDEDLGSWLQTVEPTSIRPGLDFKCDNDELVFATFLSTQYHLTLITLHQAALMVDSSTYQRRIESLCKDKDSQGRLKWSESILLNSARQIATLHIDLADKGINTQLLTATAMMTAIVVIGLSIMKHPAQRRNRLDLQLLQVLSYQAETAYVDTGQNPDFIKVIEVLRNNLEQQVYPSPNEHFTSPHRQHAENSRPSPRTGEIGSANPALEYDFNRDSDWTEEQFNELFHDFPVGSPWDSFLSPGPAMDG